MEEVSIAIKNCMGIKSLNESFNFNDVQAVNIYASNGTMKTSFAKSINDYAKNKEYTKSLFCKKKDVSIVSIDPIIDKERLIVWSSETSKNINPEIAKLLVDKKLKQELDEKSKSFNMLIERCVKALKKDMQVRNLEIEESELKILSSLISQNLDEYRNINYKILFNHKSEDLMRDQDILDYLNTYVKKYNFLLENSEVFNEKFTPINAQKSVSKLAQEGFFISEGNKLYMGGKIKESFKDVDDFLTEQASLIVQNENLSKINEKFRSKETKAFLAELAKNPFIIKEYIDSRNTTRCKIYSAILQDYLTTEDKDLLLSVESLIREKNELITRLKEQASEQKEMWEDTIQEYKSRFNVPFEIEIEDIDNKILGLVQSTAIKFKYHDATYAKDNIKAYLSTGERTALDILDFIFTIKLAKQNNNKPYLVIIDDIVDSFDYSNKYGFIEYLKELIEEDSNIYFVILTHSFDFFRSLALRVQQLEQNSYTARSSNYDVELDEALDLVKDNLFKEWGKSMHKERLGLKNITFLPIHREVLGFSEVGSKVMHKFLHYCDSKDLIADLKKSMPNLDISSIKHDYYTFIFKLTTSNIEKHRRSKLKLLDEFRLKILICMSLRIKTEIYMYEKLSKADQKKLDLPERSTKIFTLYKNVKPTDKNFKQVKSNLIKTPELIHLSGLMYEPLVDICVENLIQSYNAFNQIIPDDYLIKDSSS